MGSMITLRLGRLEVDWGKNNFFINHSPLFRATDFQEADYYYADDVVERKPAYVRKLRHVILDNDTAGRAALQKLGRLRMPLNIRLVRLPDLEAFRACPTLGPSGRLTEDVNGRAVAIECFLDLAFGPKEERAVRWTSFNHDVGAYQGELLAKDEYTKQFFAHVGSNGYDPSKLRLLWSHILQAGIVTGTVAGSASGT